MRHYGDEPPWRGRSYHLGSWRWMRPDPESWFDEPGYWEWIAPPSSLAGYMSGIIGDFYLGPLQRQLNENLTLLNTLRYDDQATHLRVCAENAP